ncbi:MULTISPECIES: FISUMP domain-containing protein [unclassified Dysgonomonas]|uniref:FISUMP domain-containing protein n=1 Tax=unclassified Dysgonomonas TaxID=2630389 RepID=UPI0013EBCB89|nr:MULTISPECIES: FISUMP domain-containing protein [unclassified Dysgonomonas]
MRKTKLFYVLITAFLLSWKVNAQVTIGSGEAPSAGALLDLKENKEGMSTKGLGMPRVPLSDLTNLYPMLTGSETDYETLKASHVGLMVYNTTTQETANRICPGLHLWTGEKWESLIPYPIQPVGSKILKSDKLNGFTFLDPNSPTNWPADKDRSQYPLGYIGTFTDSRGGDTPQTYNYTRFYVGLANRTKTYEVQENYSCSNTLVSGNAVTTIETGDYFEDGVWMNDNLRAEVIDPVRDNGDIILILTENYTYSHSETYFGYPNKVSANKNTLGVLYNWAAATNGKGGATGQEGTVSEGELAEGTQRQGICPSGWHLPSDREWTNLENAIIINTSLFSTTPNIGSANILDYALYSWRGTTHGTAMKSTTSADGTTATGGTSNPVTQGGFNGLLSGNSDSSNKFGTQGYWWSSSNSSATLAWRRSLQNTEAKGYRWNNSARNAMHSVRCKRN